MANLKLNFPDTFFKEMDAIALGSNLDNVVEAVLKAGANVVIKEEKAMLESVLKDDEVSRKARTGQLEHSIGKTPVKRDDKGNSDISVGFYPKRKEKITNKGIAVMMEYGTSKMKARPFVKKTRRKVKDSCVKAMVDEYDRQIRKYISE